MKFGGTSMGSAERMKVAARLTTEQHAQRRVVIVVSAMSKVTDLLLDSMRKAEAGDEAGLDANLKALRTRHITCCQQHDALGDAREFVDQRAHPRDGVRAAGGKEPLAPNLRGQPPARARDPRRRARRRSVPARVMPSIRRRSGWHWRRR